MLTWGGCFCSGKGDISFEAFFMWWLLHKDDVSNEGGSSGEGKFTGLMARFKGKGKKNRVHPLRGGVAP